MLKSINISKIKFTHPQGYMLCKGFAIEAMPGYYVADANNEIMLFDKKRIADEVISQFKADNTDLSFIEPEVYNG
jgi:hypothetical protein